MNLARIIEDLKTNILGQTPGYPFMMRGREDVLFVHITKTAGTAIKRALNFHRNRKDFNGFTHAKHLSARDIRHIIGPEKFDRAFSFAFVRNPWSRTVSLYRYKIRKNPNIKLHSDFSFDQFVKTFYGQKKPSLAFAGKNYWTQLDWITDENGKIIVDFVGKFENIEQDSKIIMHKILGKSISLPSVNVNHPPLDYRTFYTEELKELIAEYFKEDIDYFGYAF